MQTILPTNYRELFSLGAQECHFIIYQALSGSEVDYQNGEDNIITYGWSFEDSLNNPKIGQQAVSGCVDKGEKALPWLVVGVEQYLPTNPDNLLKSIVIAWCRRAQQKNQNENK